jgi:hypothetical protein
MGGFSEQPGTEVRPVQGAVDHPAHIPDHFPPNTTAFSPTMKWFLNEMVPEPFSLELRQE